MEPSVAFDGYVYYREMGVKRLILPNLVWCFWRTSQCSLWCGLYEHVLWYKKWNNTKQYKTCQMWIYPLCILFVTRMCNCQICTFLCWDKLSSEVFWDKFRKWNFPPKNGSVEKRIVLSESVSQELSNEWSCQ
jgi:hypothetical protein